MLCLFCIIGLISRLVTEHAHYLQTCVTLQMASSSKQEVEEESALGGPVFHPPLYKQRYDEVTRIARKTEAKKVRFLRRLDAKMARA